MILVCSGAAWTCDAAIDKIEEYAKRVKENVELLDKMKKEELAKAELPSSSGGSDQMSHEPPTWVMPGGPGIPCSIGVSITRVTPPSIGEPHTIMGPPPRLVPCPGTQ